MVKQRKRLWKPKSRILTWCCCLQALRPWPSYFPSGDSDSPPVIQREQKQHDGLPGRRQMLACPVWSETLPSPSLTPPKPPTTLPLRRSHLNGAVIHMQSAEVNSECIFTPWSSNSLMAGISFSWLATQSPLESSAHSPDAPVKSIHENRSSLEPMAQWRIILPLSIHTARRMRLTLAILDFLHTCSSPGLLHRGKWNPIPQPPSSSVISLPHISPAHPSLSPLVRPSPHQRLSSRRFGSTSRCKPPSSII